MTGGSTAPDLSAQSAEQRTPSERRAWFQCRAEDMRDEGATWRRMTVDDAGDPTVTLIEGWFERPAEQVAPHFYAVPA